MHLKDLLGSIARSGYCIQVHDFYMAFHSKKHYKGLIIITIMKWNVMSCYHFALCVCVQAALRDMPGGVSTEVQDMVEQCGETDEDELSPASRPSMVCIIGNGKSLDNIGLPDSMRGECVYPVYMEENYQDPDLHRDDLDWEILSCVNTRSGSRFNPDIGWIAISGPSNNDFVTLSIDCPV